MASLIQDFELLEAIAGDLAAFAAGQPVSATQKIGNSEYSASVVPLPNGPSGQYQAFSGSFLNILELAFADFAAFTAGAPINLAEKIGKTWYGVSVSRVPTAAAAAAAAPTSA